MDPRGDRPFEQFVRDRTEAGYVERRWLAGSIQSALDAEPCRIVLLTGEPGAGKSNVLAGLARDNDRWLRYFVGQPDQDVQTSGDVTSFLMSIGHQFKRLWPGAFDVKRLEIVVQQHIDRVDAGGSALGIKISDVTASPFHNPIFLKVDQSAKQAAGQITGVEINFAQVEPRLLDTANLAHLALVAPAEVLRKLDPSARVVVLLDALDEATRTGAGDGLLDWLSDSGVLPPNVRVVVSSRPISALGILRAGRKTQLAPINVDPADRRVWADLTAYTNDKLDTADVDQAVRAHGLVPDEFRLRVVKRASGNFQYLASYTRALTEAIADGHAELSARLLQLDTFPSGLVGIYTIFAETARRDVERLGMLAVKEPVNDADKRTPAWEEVGQPVIGVLAVAREPLSIEQLTRLADIRVWPTGLSNVLRKLRWLLEKRAGKYSFFHQSIGDFLVSDQAAAECADCHIDETEWNERILSYYRGTASTWDKVTWTDVDSYGLAHIADHLERAAPRDLVRLVCPGLRQAIKQTFGTDQRFLHLVDRSATHVTRTGDVADALSDVMYLGVVRHQMSAASTSLPPAAVGLFARLGRLREALDRVGAMRPSARRFASMLNIVRHARPGPDDPSTHDLVDLLVDTAVALGEGSVEGEGLARKVHPWAATKVAAQVLAANDLDRALGLWEHGKLTVGGQQAQDEHPDRLYRSAARAEADIWKARALIARMRDGRASSYLDLAERADHSQIAAVLLDAEFAAASQEPASRLRELARVAAAWAPHDTAKTATLLAQVRAGASAGLTDAESSEHVALAAEAICAVDSETARMLLTSLDTVAVDGRFWEGLRHACELWTRWGETDRAWAIARRLRAWHRDSWYELRIHSALNPLDRAGTVRMIEQIHAAIPNADEVHGGLESGIRNHSLARVVRELAQYDTVRAAEIAGEMSREEWVEQLNTRDDLDPNGFPEIDTRANPDRHTLVAEVAHRCLDRDNETAAEQLLNEILRHTEHTRPPGADPQDHTAYLREAIPLPKSSVYRVVPVNPIGEPKSLRHYEVDGIMEIHNISQEWSTRANQDFYRDPADLIRAVSFGPYSLARTVRVLAESGRDRARATAVVRTIADTGERAIGLAGLHLVAHTPALDHGPEAEAASQELDRTLPHLETYRWTVSIDDQDKRAWAYMRPDYRVSFEIAVRALGCRPQDYAALEQLPFLGHAMARSLILRISGTYASERIRGQQPHPSFAQAHEGLLAGHDGDLVSDIAQVQAACHELRIRTAIPHHRSTAPWGHISNPIYAAALAMARPEPGAALSPAFAATITDLTEQGRLPAAADLVTFAAHTRPECSADLHTLGAEIVAATVTSSPAERVDTLARLTGAPALAGLVDPVAVFHEAERCTADPWARWVPEDAQARVFPAMLANSPAIALHKLYEAAATRWELAMRLLESAADPLVAAFSDDPAEALAAGIRRGLACAAIHGQVPNTVDGVHIDELARLAPTRNGRSRRTESTTRWLLDHADD